MTADELAATMYDTMKAPSPARLLFDALQAVQSPDDRRTVLGAVAPAERQALMVYAQRRAHWVEEAPSMPLSCTHARNG